MSKRALFILVLLAAVLGALVPIPHAFAQIPGTLVETVTVDASNPLGKSTVNTLEAFATYRLTARGTFLWDKSHGGLQADPECSLNTRESMSQPGWQRYRFMFLFTDAMGASLTFPVTTDFYDIDPADDIVDLYVDNRNMEWFPTDPGLPAIGIPPAPPNPRAEAYACNKNDHTYVSYFSPPVARKVNFRVYDVVYGDNSVGNLSVTIEKVAPAPPALPVATRHHQETVIVNSYAPEPIKNIGSNSSIPLTAGAEYLIVAHGNYMWNNTFPQQNALADSECSRTVEDATYRRYRVPESQIPGDALDLWINGINIEWQPIKDNVAGNNLEGCDKVSYYYTTIVGGGQTVNFKINDPGPHDNTGNLSVEIFAKDPTPAPVGVVARLEPPYDVKLVGESHTVRATILDQRGQRLPGASVRFVVEGAHDLEGTATTNPDGEAFFSYPGSQIGQDLITAETGFAKAAASVTWGTQVGPPPGPGPGDICVGVEITWPITFDIPICVP